jgi:hypothetical protein
MVVPIERKKRHVNHHKAQENCKKFKSTAIPAKKAEDLRGKDQEKNPKKE